MLLSRVNPSDIDPVIIFMTAFWCSCGRMIPFIRGAPFFYSQCSKATLKKKTSKPTISKKPVVVSEKPVETPQEGSGPSCATVDQSKPKRRPGKRWLALLLLLLLILVGAAWFWLGGRSESIPDLAIQIEAKRFYEARKDELAIPKDPIIFLPHPYADGLALLPFYAQAGNPFGPTFANPHLLNRRWKYSRRVPTAPMGLPFKVMFCDVGPEVAHLTAYVSEGIPSICPRC
jgi:hypothetical protein